MMANRLRGGCGDTMGYFKFDAMRMCGEKDLANKDLWGLREGGLVGMRFEGSLFGSFAWSPQCLYQLLVWCRPFKLKDQMHRKLAIRGTSVSWGIPGTPV